MGNVQMSSSGGMLLLFLTGAFTVATTVYWMVVGWRAMRAHERIADTLERRLPQ